MSPDTGLLDYIYLSAARILLKFLTQATKHFTGKSQMYNNVFVWQPHLLISTTFSKNNFTSYMFQKLLTSKFGNINCWWEICLLLICNICSSEDLRFEFLYYEMA